MKEEGERGNKNNCTDVSLRFCIIIHQCSDTQSHLLHTHSLSPSHPHTHTHTHTQIPHHTHTHTHTLTQSKSGRYELISFLEVEESRLYGVDSCSISNVQWQWVPDRRTKVRESTHALIERNFEEAGVSTGTKRSRRIVQLDMFKYWSDVNMWRCTDYKTGCTVLYFLKFAQQGLSRETNQERIAIAKAWKYKRNNKSLGGIISGLVVNSTNTSIFRESSFAVEIDVFFHTEILI